ncbi:MAG: tRNA (adenosine(37)-N6)-dimethylallyltransferase, partial [Pseudonocardiaceae bacterium]
MRPRVVAVVGPTATGKSDLAVGLAIALGGEVINADAMQLYRGMDIGTAKLTAQQQRGVRHHLLDTLDVHETASVAVYQVQARAVLEELLDEGRVPILAGGSGLYVRAVLDELDFP